MREILLLRHATAEGRAARDQDRRLTEKGRLEAVAVGRRLSGRGWVPDLALSSPAVRALDTCKEVCTVLGVPPAAIRVEPVAYDAVPSALLAILAAVPRTARRVLLVGHNPGLSQLASHLIDDGRLDTVGLEKGGSAWCTLPDDWSSLPAGIARLHRVESPPG